MSPPSNTAELSKLQKYWESCEELFPSLEKQARKEIFSRVVFCVKHGVAMRDPDEGHLYTEDINLFGKILEWPRQIVDFHERSKVMQKNKSAELHIVLTERMNIFADELKATGLTISTLRSESVFSASTVKKGVSKVKRIKATLEQNTIEAELINTQERDIGLENVTDYKSQLDEFKRISEPLSVLWECSGNYLNETIRWYSTHLKELNAEKIENDADSMRRTVLKVRKKFLQFDMPQSTYFLSLSLSFFLPQKQEHTRAHTHTLTKHNKQVSRSQIKSRNNSRPFCQT